MFSTSRSNRAAIAAAMAAAALLLHLGAPLAAFAQATSAAAATQSSIDRGVTVKVTPKAIGAADGRWEFDVVLGGGIFAAFPEYAQALKECASPRARRRTSCTR